MKIFILEPSFKNIANDVALKLISINNDLNICKKHSSNKIYENHTSELFEYMNIDDINLSFKNNSLLFITYLNEEIHCLTTDNYYNGDIVCAKYSDFNNIISKYLGDVVIIWLDNSSHKKNIDKKQLHKDIVQVQYLETSIKNNNLNYLYFLNDTVDNITNVINNYINGSEEERNKILEEYI